MKCGHSFNFFFESAREKATLYRSLLVPKSEHKIDTKSFKGLRTLANSWLFLSTISTVKRAVDLPVAFFMEKGESRKIDNLA